jgi:hypothetical protein
MGTCRYGRRMQFQSTNPLCFAAAPPVARGFSAKATLFVLLRNCTPLSPASLGQLRSWGVFIIILALIRRRHSKNQFGHFYQNLAGRGPSGPRPQPCCSPPAKTRARGPTRNAPSSCSHEHDEDPRVGILNPEQKSSAKVPAQEALAPDIAIYALK